MDSNRKSNGGRLKSMGRRKKRRDGSQKGIGIGKKRRKKDGPYCTHFGNLKCVLLTITGSEPFFHT